MPPSASHLFSLLASLGTEIPEKHRRAIELLCRLQSITAALASAVTAADVGKSIIDEALPALNAATGVVVVLEPDGKTLTNVQFQGVSKQTQESWSSFPIDTPIPIAEAALLQAPIIVATRLERNARYPALAAFHGAEGGGGVTAYPLLHGGRVVGSLGFCFAVDREPDVFEQSYLETLAQQCATALARILDDKARKSAEDALRVSRTQLQLISDITPIYIASCDRQHRFKFCNRAYAERLGLRPQDLTGRSTREILGEPGYAAALPYIERVLKGEPVEYTAEIPYPSIGRKWVECRYAPEVDDRGEVQGWVAVICDVTEQKRAVEALRSRERELSLIYRNVSDVIFLLAVEAAPDAEVRGPAQAQAAGALANPGPPQFRFVSVNRAFLAATGLQESDVVGKSVSEVIPEPSYSLVVRKYRQAISQRATVTWEETTPYPSGVKVGTVVVTPLFDSKGVCTNLVGAVHDVTGLKLAEQALREADRRKDEFLAMLAHELRNPLGPIRNGVSLLRKMGDDRRAQSRIHDMIERQSTHMSRIVDDLLDVSRITRGKISLQREELDLDELLRATAHDYATQFQQKEVTLTVLTPEIPVYILGDRTRITQSIGNLLHNAQKFTCPGGAAKVTLSDDGQQAFLTVTDNGIGMDSATLARLFIPFSQADQSLERSTGGLGLGLSLVQGLINLHGGTVTVHSPGIGHGSTVRITLPLIQVDRSAVGRDEQVSQKTLQKILIIEDNADAAESLQLLLSLSGHAVNVASSGPAALKVLESESPDIIICDIGLPGGMSGYEVAKAVRAEPRFDRTFMVALTGYGQPDDQQAALASGFDVHLTKPVDPDKLESMLDSAMSSTPRRK